MYLTLTDLLWWFLIALLGYSWWHGRGLKDAALRAVRKYCDSQDVQLLDESLVLSGIKPGRGDDGRLCLKRHYRFEFSSTGDERYPGTVEMVGRRIRRITLDTHRMPD
ncbi:DUF3301 domain-containing protein [Motiliproteus coralliicola]|uniref:DUF3301 domain-containing protein n=1 Tax=Motiliproteus coralliicola TaxID=2283196 RepID=A0A369WGW2_9GAMM|nr:DUF3301 domain-containing protein [Motiliproteus coralliicola]RDE19856.1 DUF3301 domain-containing protein [Motiliproteus coralliicola]